MSQTSIIPITKNKSHFELAVGLATLASLVLFVGGLQSHFMRHTRWIALLFVIPFVVQVGGLIVLYNNPKFENNTARATFSWFYLTTMQVCLVCYCSLWWIYSHLEQKYDWLSTSEATPKYKWMINQGTLSYLKSYSVIALILIVILLLLVTRMTYAIIEGKVLIGDEQSTRRDWQFWNLDYLRTGAATVPFLALLFFLSVFLGVSYLFGFALAFHDKTHSPTDPALYMSNLHPLPTIPSQVSKTRVARPNATSTFTFKFVEGSASLPWPNLPKPDFSRIVGSKSKSKIRPLELSWQEACNYNASLFHESDLKLPTKLAIKLRDSAEPFVVYLRSRLSPQSVKLLRQFDGSDPAPETIRAGLLSELNRLVIGDSLYNENILKGDSLPESTRILIASDPHGPDQLRLNRLLLEHAFSEELMRNRLDELISQITDATKRHERIRVIVTGYSDGSPLSGNSYQSNYELSEARAQNTKQMVIDSLPQLSFDTDWQNIDWVTNSLSNELSESEKTVRVQLQRVIDDSASIILKGQHPVPLNLMDYIYFANYTITTTGYGDIIPTTAYAKFVCSLANICEVFFLVVFFNTLLSLESARTASEKHYRTMHEISGILEQIKNSHESLIESFDTTNNLNHQSETESTTAATLEKLMKANESMRRKIKRIEELLNEKISKSDVEASVKDNLQNFSISQYLLDKLRNK